MRKLGPKEAFLFFAALHLNACKNMNRDSELRQAMPLRAETMPLKTVECQIKAETPEDNSILPFMTCDADLSFTAVPESEEFPKGKSFSTSTADEFSGTKKIRVGTLQLRFGESIQILGLADVNSSKQRKDSPFYRVLIEKELHKSSCRKEESRKEQFAEISHKYLTQACIERLNGLKNQ